MSLNLESIFYEEKDIPAEFTLDEQVDQREFLSNGEMISWTGQVNEVFSPICVKTKDGLKRKRIGSFPVCTEKESMEALEAAVKAYDNGRGEWPTMSVADRITCVENFTQKMIAKKDIVVKLIMWEIGKSYADSVKEFDRTVEYIYATIDALKDIDRDSSRFQIEQGIVAQIRRSPLGVVLCMGPFNYPLNETFTTLIPALIMGNTMLFKPPKHGTLLHYPLLEAFRTSFPKGVVNTIYGRGNKIVPSLMQSGKINVLTLIGSSRVADELKKLHPKVNRLRAILGLDAKNAAIITKDADLNLAVSETVLGSLSFNGQRCTALKIIYVHRSLAQEFLKRLSAEVAKLKYGMPWEKGVSLTPLPEVNKPAYLTECIEDAKAYGAKVVNENGGQVAESFFYPAIVYPVNSQMKLYREEQFGPVIPVVPFDDLEEPIEYLIGSSHGQQVSIFSNNAAVVSSLIDPLVNQVSRVNINCQCQRGPDTFPFTGRKDSAEGTLSVVDALRSFSIRSLVATKFTEENKKLLNEIVSENESNFLSTKYIF
ncbi:MULTISPECIES: NADP-dependent glyceraldehyde-3-phosphate dehydrogenase [Sphingobacterium]|jgi:acyl-CoA reductase-like NAD-dependent aldehyde dehydrogenase|uniref:Acyl-CoA reductase-like NAD-dependent aldehyde dehydrogenase n=1 Tax=Sphingobacterium siyangense TaxID=459529 RepID=A0A562MDC5_9SPHI|nr:MULTISPECIES: NADP-dependent glyceraldehyde-3-phosphate dehydrogenase [Sphingobacterium]APU94955.1 NADP-dependent glyceraldehyde-3-phosphate dehydrogenase [Sphingobacterium sp. B29]MDR0261635.1 NADP-dependent glyceraldehyde-3-phosphate dehydrogenase [Sphingobacterium sp.]TWI17916.1 acyl-CoA reductase-like NAD-dependent aldehyde dehydrogenase [Sphingobacterium siyangense]UQA75267.1 NADP-dependent glyceraldehyde-3-phosphate dehydrogenase [Sphingobacterium siyangense]HAL54815.1 NADP-dependent 